MKKFAKILGFLGFFVMLATAQIGTAWAESVECQPGYYLPMGETTCIQCPSAANNGGVGVFCSGNVGYPYENAPYQVDMGIEPCGAKQCSSDYSWNLTPAGASSPSKCKGDCKTDCIHPNSNCPLPNINLCGYNRNIEVNGQIECFGSCTPENTPENYCPVTCPKSCEGSCICPNGNCNGYVVTNIPGVQNCNSNTCDVTHQLVGNQYISVPETSYQCLPADGCKVECSHDGTPNCPNGTTCEWNPNSPSPVLGYLDDQNKCRDYSTGNIIENFACDIVITGCADQCQYWDESKEMCVTYQSDTYYKCGNQSAVQGPNAVCGDPYTINRTTDQGTEKIIDTSICAPAGYRFQGWKLTIDYSPYNGNVYTDPDVPDYNRFERWQATTNDAATFEAQWEEDKLYVYYKRYGGAWVQSNPPADDKEAFTISDLPLTKTWTLSRDNSTFRGWCDDLYYSHLSDTTWLDAHCHSPYKIPTGTTSDVYLYAWWKCTDGYSLGSDYQCEGGKINVKYTCHAPENSSYNDTSYTYNDAATYGQEYKPVKSVEDVAEAPNSTACQFAGYEIDPQLGNSYQWILKNWNYSTGGKYSPGATMAANDWQHISPTPETEIEFELEPNVWKVKKYSVQYRCGSIDNYTFNAPGYVTDDGAIYNTNYIVANNNILSQFNELCAPADGYTLQNWTFACPGYENVPEGPYASGANFGTWTYDSNDCYFTANWAQTDFVIILDQNGGTDGDPSDYLYTRKNIGVYLDSARTLKMLPDHESNANPLTPPQKTINITIYPDSTHDGTGASFTYNGTIYGYNGANNYANIDENLDFMGYYQNITSNPEKYIDPYEGKGYITGEGIAAGKTYDENYTVPQRTWVAHWGTYDLPLPSTATWNGHDFAGWKCVDDEDNTIYTWTPGNDSTPAVTGISENITCTAQWSVACRSVSFNENGGESTNGGNNGRFWKISDQTGWYADSTCTSNATPNVENRRPTKENATFIGYDDTVSAPTVRIFDNLGAITTGGENWTITQNAILYAQYECVAPYHLMDDGSCGSCPGGSFYNPSSTNPNHCDTCDQYLNAPSGTWDTRSPYNWSVKQCYRVCDGVGDTQQTCDVVNTVSNHSEMEQFLTGNLINGNTGKQISFYGNEFATSGAFNTCNSETGVTNCPQGFLANGASGANKLMAAAVDFYEKRDLNGAYELNGKRYIVGERSVADGVYKLNNGFVWSQVVGDAQLEGNPGIISIIYPATFAPTVANPEHHTFAGYGYPESTPSQNQFVDSNYSLTSGSDGNAKEIIDFANANNYSNMSPIIANSNYTRNLYAQYTAADSYTLTYSCGEGGGTPPAPQIGIYAGNTVPISVPSDCSHYSTHSLREWAVTATESGQNLGTVPASNTSITWNYTQDMTFTAQWTDGCYEVTFNNNRHGGQPIISTLKFYKQGTRWYADTEAKCDGDSINPSVAGMLPTKEHASFIGYDDEDGTNQRIFDGNGYPTYAASSWTITGATVLYAQYDCDDGYTLDGTTCVLDSSNFHMITLDKNVGNLHGEDSNPTVLYTIEGNTTVYENVEHTEPFSHLDENPKKYAYVKFHFCDGDNNSCERPSTEDVTKNAYFTFDGFYVQHPDEYDRYISSDGSITTFGGQVASTYVGDRTWYAVWNDYGTVAQSDWQSNPTQPSGYAFGGWWTSPNCAGTQMTDNDHFTADTELYACWERSSCPDDEILIGTDCKKKCWVDCTWDGQPTNPTACPYDIVNIPYVQNCTYNPDSPAAQGPGYRPSDGSTQCLDSTTNQQITPESCNYTVNCELPRVWDPDTLSCVYPSGTKWKIKFVCDTNNLVVQEYEKSVGELMESIPSNTSCVKPGYSFTQWKDAEHNDTLTAGASNVPWTHEYNATYTPDWNDGNVYHVNLHAYSCDDSTQTGTFGNSGVQELWEKYGVNWYRTNVGGTLSNPITELTTQQLPTRSGWTFGGYNTLGGDQRVRYANGAWNVSPTTLITEDEEWCAIWSQCNPNEYWNNGVCVTCNTATNGDFPLGDANATSINQCYRQCSICTQVCPQTEGVDYCEFGNNSNMNGNLYYPGTGTCQPNYEQNCPITVLHCLPGYTPNGNNTACVPNNYMITLNSHRDSFYGDDSVPTALYTKFGTNGGIWLNQYYTRPMVVGTMLDNNPTKYATVILSGNGGSFQWNGYPVTQANAQANFEFNGFYNSVNGGIQYISDTDGLLTTGLTAAQQIPDDQTWHAQWTNGSVTLPNATRDGYTFNGWWTLPSGGASAGDAGSTYTPVTANPTLYAQWVNGVYYINYHDDEGPLFFNASTSHCTPTTYTYGTQLTISCQLTPTANSHAVFKGWCKTPGANCATTQTITSTDYGNKDYYAWWECESGYNANNGVCVPNASELCPARTLPNNAHATFESGALNSNGTECIYTLKCEACTGCNNNNYTCYTNGSSANNNGIFTVIGTIGDANVLADTHCNPTEYDVYYRCDGNSQGYAAQTKAVYGQAYSVEYNPHNNANGGQLNCQSDNQLFNGWTFNGNNQTYYPGTPNYMINSWNYCDITPIFTASYGQCPAGEVYVPSLGQCKEECYVPCKVPTNGACPNDFDLTPTSTGVHAYCGTYGGQAPNPQGPGYYLYPAPHVNEACLHVHTSNEITPQQCTDVSVVYCVDSNGTQSSHYTWDWDMHQCKPRTYSVTLNSNNGIEGSNFVNKLYEQYNVGWSRYLDGEFTSTLNLSQSELPTARETCKVFDGYWNDVAGYRTISATGYLSLPATTLTDNTQVWNARYVNDSNAYTITFQCSNGTVVSTQPGVVFNQGNVTAPVRSLCPGEAFTQWVSGNVTLNAGTIYPNWQYCSNMTFTPDVSNSAVWEVTLLPGDGTFDSNDIRKLYDAVNVGWYTNRDLSEQSRIIQIDNDKVPTKQGANFVGYKNQNGDWRVNYFNGSGWDLPRTNDLSGSETWTAQYNLCQASYYYQDGQCKLCPSGYTSDPTTATQPEHCYVQCETCVEPACPSIPHSTGCEFYHNNNENYPGYLFYSQNGQNKCVKRTFNYNFTETIMCNWCAICDEANGWIRDSNNCQVCVPSWQSNGHTIDLNSLRMTDFDGDPTGDDVEPVRLYTWPDRGVYLDSTRNRLMTVGASGNNPVGTPTTYGVVRFDPNGGTFNMDGYTYTNRYGDRYVYANFRGFYNSQTGSVIYIDNTGHITQSGDDWGRTAGYDVTWYAKWQYGTIGELPTPTRLGYTFTGWYDSISGGNLIYENTRVERSMNVYARWEKAKYFVNLDKNGGQWGSDPVYKLWELYGTGWSTEEYGAFNSDLTLMESQRPSWPGNSKVFNGYWTARNNGTQQIRADGSVVDTTATVLTGDNTTWYAQYVDNTNKYTITFRCSENGEPLSGYTQRVQNGDNVRVPSKSACSNEGHTMTNWTGNHNTTFNAQDTEYMATWSGVFTNEDFTPTWNDGNVYRVTLDQNGATQQGVTDLYEKYGMWWSQYQNGNPQITFLSGSDLPSKTGFNFGGYADENDRPVGSYNPTNNKWNLPDNTTVSSNGIIWTAIWTPCTGGQYWDGNKCYQCPTGFTDNPSAVDNEDYCYGNCRYNCRDVCPLANQLPEGMESCTPNTEGYPQPGRIYYGTQLQGCLPEGTYGNQPGLPNCESIITCKPGYHLVNGVCVEYVKTDIMLNPNGGTWASNVPSEYRYLYTIESTGVYRDSDRTEEMTPNNNMSLHAIPSNGASITLNANGGIVTWGGGTGEILNRNAAFEFLGFYDSQTPGFAAQYILPREINGETYAFITTGGQSAGIGYTTTPHTWYAQWSRSVTLPAPERQNYTFVGWTYNGELVSNPWMVPGNATNITLIAQWTKNDGTIVAYKCDDGDGGIGGTGYDTLHPAYFGENYNVLPNGIVNGGVVNCSKPANITLGRRYHEFEDWVFSGDYAHYDPGEINWTFNVDNPTFTANYEECPNGWYFDGSCKQCPNGYTSSDIDADSASKCYKTCDVPCTQPTSQCPMNEEGVLACTYPNNTYPLGKQYSGSDNCLYKEEDVPLCEPFTIMCKPGYTPDYYLSTDTGTHCTKLDQYEITLDQNGGTGGQDKIYTIYNTGVYRDAGRIYSMTQYPLLNLPLKSVNVTFNSCDNNDPNCENATVWERPVDLEFKGYYQTASNNSQYIYATGLITSTGLAEGKSYTDNNQTWYAQWDSGTVDSDKWPLPPTRQNACVTYSFYGWYTEINGGTPVSPATPVYSDVTWYAHWCESCPTGAIANGSCNPQNCKATFTCNNGYAWDETQCQCVAATGLTLTYQPNGGMPDEIYTENRYFGETFTTRDGNTYTKVGHIIAKWANVGVGGGSFPLLAHSYPYNYNGNTTLEPEWKQCTCTFNGNSGVESCDANIVTNNTCTPDVVCKPGYVNGHYTCINEHLETCTAMCDICPAGTFQNDNQCSPCTGNNVSAAGATQCEPCDPGYTANPEHTQCVGNPITIDWDENGGRLVDNGICQFCTNGCDGITCESCGAHPDNMLTLANVTHSNSAMQFLGWKLFRGDSNYPAGTNVMCTYDNVGVYSGTSTKIQAQWNECQCSDQLNPHVVCQPVIVDDVCRHVYWCDSVGYNIVGDDYSNTSPYCDPRPFDVTYNCGVGATGTPLISADTATYDDTYIVKNAGGVNCQKVGFNFVGWLFDGDNYLHQADDRITWTYTSNKTFTAQYTNIQCASDEILIGNYCVKCNCTIGTGATSTSCGMLSTNSNTCEWTHPVTCQTGFVTPAWSCTGTGNTNCTASCSVCPENQVEVGGSCVDCECTPDTTTGAVSCGTRSVSNNMCNWGPAICTPGHHNPNITCSGSSNQSCEATCGTCPANTYGPDGLECIQCPDGYTSPAGSTSIEDCYNNPTSYTITYRPGEGVNPQTGNNQPVLQPVTYWANFTTLMGTTFTMGNHILTRWDLVGDDTSTFDKHQDPDTNQYYAKLNEYYDHYNTLGNTILDAHWEQCTCTTGNGVSSCTTSSTSENACACAGECAVRYIDGGCSCNGTSTCTQTCTECPAGYISNADQTECVICPENTYQSGNTCEQCPTGYTSPAGSTSIEDCYNNPVSYTVHYSSNNGLDQTETQPVVYGTTFTTLGGTTFTYDNHIMTRWNKISGGDYTELSHPYEYGVQEDTFLKAQWAECTCATGNGVSSCTTSSTSENACTCTGECAAGYVKGECSCSGNTCTQSCTKCADNQVEVNGVCVDCSCSADGDGVVSGCGFVSNENNVCHWGPTTCGTGYGNPGDLSCDDSVHNNNCRAICSQIQSNAIYNCGTGTGIPPVSELVSYGTPYTIKANATVYGCSRENSTFAGWEFDGDQQIHAAGDTVTWNYTTDKNFRAVYCNNCPTIAHGTCELEMPTAGQCDWNITCYMGYKLNETKDNCVPISVTLEYQSNGGTPVAGYTYEYAMSYGDGFRTLDGGAFEKSRHIFNEWQTVGLGGSFPKLNWDYTYNYAGNTTLQPNWTLCPDNTISLNNQCQQCQCTENAGVTSCETSATNDDTCSCSGECAAGYINAGCNCDGTNCTQSCTKCADNQVSVNNVCEDCVCNVNDDSGATSCGTKSVIDNMCNWGPATCRPGYAYPTIICDGSNNQLCEASCTICPAGTYQDGEVCTSCPTCQTSLPGATSVNECFTDSTCCAPDEHIEHGECTPNVRRCSIPDATNAVRIWNPAIGTYGPCTVQVDGCNTGYHVSGNVCVKDTEACTVEHGHGERDWNGTSWDACGDVVCDPGYEPNSDYTACVECSNRRVNGDIAVSGYIYECEIAACMYQGQKYTLEGNECVPICTADRFTREDPSNPTGTIQWDERTKKCIRTCKPGYKMW